MVKRAYIILPIFILVSVVAFIIAFRDEIRKEAHREPEIVNIDGCEYIHIKGGLFATDKYQHKANCKNHDNKN